MADRRPDPTDGNRAKRQKLESSSTENTMDKKPYNKYLAHMYEEDDGEDMNRYSGVPLPRMNENSNSPPLAKFQRHQSTSSQARKAEDGPTSPFNGKPLSKQYFSILKTRRGLPVHAQRCVFLSPSMCTVLLTALQG